MNLAEVYERLGRTRPADPAITFHRAPACGTTLTWADLAERAAELEHTLRAHGLRPGTRWAVVLADHPDLIPMFLAIWRSSGVAVPLDPLWGEDLSEHVIRHSHADAVVEVGSDRLRTVPGHERRPPLPPDAAMISYTSGSTADPKGVVLRHSQLLSAYRSGADAVRRLVGRPVRRFGCGMRMSGLGILGMNYLWPAVQGAEVAVLPELTLTTARKYMDGLTSLEVELSYLVPPLADLLNRMARAPDSPAVRPVFLCGGAPLAASTQHRFQERFGSPLLNAYGLTEVSFAAFFGDLGPGELATLSIGRPATAAARVRGADGEIVEGPGEGELELSGPALSDGYYDNPRADAELFHEGWLRSRDLVRRDEEGRYWIVGRSKDVVLRGAFTIYLSEVEEAAAELPGVVEAVAVRIDLPSGGEDIGLLVVTDRGTEDAIRSELERRLGRQRAPRRVVCVPGPLPRIGQGKVDRRRSTLLWCALVGDG